MPACPNAQEDVPAASELTALVTALLSVMGLLGPNAAQAAALVVHPGYGLAGHGAGRAALRQGAVKWHAAQVSSRVGGRSMCGVWVCVGGRSKGCSVQLSCTWRLPCEQPADAWSRQMGGTARATSHSSHHIVCTALAGPQRERFAWRASLVQRTTAANRITYGVPSFCCMIPPNYGTVLLHPPVRVRALLPVAVARTAPVWWKHCSGQPGGCGHRPTAPAPRRASSRRAWRWRPPAQRCVDRGGEAGCCCACPAWHVCSLQWDACSLMESLIPAWNVCCHEPSTLEVPLLGLRSSHCAKEESSLQIPLVFLLPSLS